MYDSSATSGRHRDWEAMGVFRHVSPLDPRVHLHIDRDNTMYWIEFHADSPPKARRDLRLMASMQGLEVDMREGADEYDWDVNMPEDYYDGEYIRWYLCTRETLPDIPTPRAEMPFDLSLTAFGPLSGEMPMPMM